MQGALDSRSVVGVELADTGHYILNLLLADFVLVEGNFVIDKTCLWLTSQVQYHL